MPCANQKLYDVGVGDDGPEGESNEALCVGIPRGNNLGKLSAPAERKYLRNKDRGFATLGEPASVEIRASRARMRLPVEIYVRIARSLIPAFSLSSYGTPRMSRRGGGSAWNPFRFNAPGIFIYL